MSVCLSSCLKQYICDHNTQDCSVCFPHDSIEVCIQKSNPSFNKSRQNLKFHGFYVIKGNSVFIKLKRNYSSLIHSFTHSLARSLTHYYPFCFRAQLQHNSSSFNTHSLCHNLFCFSVPNVSQFQKKTKKKKNTHYTLTHKSFNRFSASDRIEKTFLIHLQCSLCQCSHYCHGYC